LPLAVPRDRGAKKQAAPEKPPVDILPFDKLEPTGMLLAFATLARLPSINTCNTNISDLITV